MRVDCLVSISFPPAQDEAFQKTLPDTQGQAQRRGSGKILVRGGQAQGKGDRMDSVSSSRQAVTRVPREAGGVRRGGLGGSPRWRQQGVWGEEEEAGWNVL